jgi:hypothetical protein
MRNFMAVRRNLFMVIFLLFWFHGILFYSTYVYPLHVTGMFRFCYKKVKNLDFLTGGMEWSLGCTEIISDEFGVTMMVRNKPPVWQVVGQDGLPLGVLDYLIGWLQEKRA